MNIRKAKETDLDVISSIYDEIHTAEESGQLTIEWILYLEMLRGCGLLPERHENRNQGVSRLCCFLFS